MAMTWAFNGSVAPGASVTKGLIQFTTSAFTPTRMTALDISMDGGASAFWAQFKLIKGTGSYTAATGGSTLTAVGSNEAALLGAASSVVKLGTFTAELAAGSGTLTTVKQWYLPNSSGLFYQWPMGREIALQVSAVYYLQVITPASFANNIGINLEIEE